VLFAKQRFVLYISRKVFKSVTVYAKHGERNSKTVGDSAIFLEFLVTSLK